MNRRWFKIKPHRRRKACGAFTFCATNRRLKVTSVPRLAKEDSKLSISLSASTLGMCTPGSFSTKFFSSSVGLTGIQMTRGIPLRTGIGQRGASPEKSRLEPEHQ